MYLRGFLESLNHELDLYGSNNECPSTNTFLPPIYEVSTGAVSLLNDTHGRLVCQDRTIFIGELAFLPKSHTDF